MSVNKLLNANPLLAGIHINIEPVPSGNTDFLKLLKELKHRLPKGKILSVAAYRQQYGRGLQKYTGTGIITGKWPVKLTRWLL